MMRPKAKAYENIGYEAKKCSAGFSSISSLDHIYKLVEIPLAADALATIYMRGSPMCSVAEKKHREDTMDFTKSS
jgi:hypothetical protein